MDGCPLGLGLVVEDKPTEFSYNYKYVYFCSGRYRISMILAISMCDLCSAANIF